MSGIRECKENLLIRAGVRRKGYSKVVRRGEMGLRHLEFGLLRLSSGEWSGKTSKCEQALVVYSGTADLEIDGIPPMSLSESRPIFILPPNTQYAIRTTHCPVEIGMFSAPVGLSAEASAKVECSGSPGIFGPADGTLTGCRLIVTHAIISTDGEKVPHKHDAFNPSTEFPHEEICHFRVTSAQGFGLVHVYTGATDPCPMNESYEVADGDTVVIPRGYHVIGASPGSTVYCTSVLAGEVYPPRIHHTPA